jgi:hypothetical protein
MRILILTLSKHRSPRVLSESLKLEFSKFGIHSEISYQLNIFSRHSPHRLLNRFWNLLGELLRFVFLQYCRLKNFRTIIISECIPNAFNKNDYHFDDFKNLNIKLGLYEVFNILETPSQYRGFNNTDYFSVDFYDYYLSGSRRTEGAQLLKSTASSFNIGLFINNLNDSKFANIAKEELAIVDFLNPEYSYYRDEQINFLNNHGIPFIILDREYKWSELHEIYLKAKYFFIHGYESFGLPISECLFNGTIVFTPDSRFPTAWVVENELMNNFQVYDSIDDLKKKFFLVRSRFGYYSDRSIGISTRFFRDYYYGNQNEMKKFMNYLNGPC